MDLNLFLNDVQKDISRVNANILLGDVATGKTALLKSNCSRYTYIDFNEILEDCFDKTYNSLRVFDIGSFFKYINNVIGNNTEITVIDNLEVVMNILYNLDPEGQEIIKFFNDLLLQGYLGKVIFVISNIRKIKVKSLLYKSDFPHQNIKIWG